MITAGRSGHCHGERHAVKWPVERRAEHSANEIRFRNYLHFLHRVLPAEILLRCSTEVSESEGSPAKFGRTQTQHPWVGNPDEWSRSLRSPTGFADWGAFDAKNSRLTEENANGPSARRIRFSEWAGRFVLQEIFHARWLRTDNADPAIWATSPNTYNSSREPRPSFPLAKRKQRFTSPTDFRMQLRVSPTAAKDSDQGELPGGEVPSGRDRDSGINDAALLGRACVPNLSNGSSKILCHAAAFAEPHVYIFGGLTAHGCSDELWAFDLEKGVWWKVEVTRKRKLHPLLRGAIVSTDGFPVASPPTENPFRRWVVLEQDEDDLSACSEMKPPPRYNHSLVAWRDYLVLFGGDRAPGYCDDLWMFDIKKSQWERVHQEDCRPVARAGHSASVHENSMIVYGGWRGSDGFSDVWSYDLVVKKWMQLCPNVTRSGMILSNVDQNCHESQIINEGIPCALEGGNVPLARHWHIAAVFGDFLYIHGGYGSIGVLREVWNYCLSDPSAGWHHVPTTGTVPNSRCRHSGAKIDCKRWAVLGGKNCLGSYFNDFHIFDVDTRVWQHVNLFSLSPFHQLQTETFSWWNSPEILQRLPALHCHTMCFVPSHSLLVIVGGCDGDCNAKNNTILLRRNPTAVLLFAEWKDGKDSQSPLANFIREYGEPYCQSILQFL